VKWQILQGAAIICKTAILCMTVWIFDFPLPPLRVVCPPRSTLTSRTRFLLTATLDWKVTHPLLRLIHCLHRSQILPNHPVPPRRFAPLPKCRLVQSSRPPPCVPPVRSSCEATV
jgi:hypothetical protein